MGVFLDSVPFSGIIRIRDMMFSVADPYRLDQGDVSFDSPDTVKNAMARAIAENRTHYLQTTGVPRLRELIAAKLRDKNGIPVDDPEQVLVTNGGIHGVYIVCQALFEPGDEVIVPDPEWPPAAGNILAARATPIACPLHESSGWRYDLDELASKISPKTRAIYLNSPHNPTGGVLTRADIERIAAMARDRNLWVLSDEAYEDVVFAGEHVSIASLPGMYDRTIPLYTFSKSYAMTGLRLGYVAIREPAIRERAKKALFYTASNVSSVVQYGGIGALEGSQDCITEFRTELGARRDLFYAGVREAAGDLLSGQPPAGAFYAFLRVDPKWNGGPQSAGSISWRMTEHLIRNGRIGCVPGIDFGANGEGYVRFCFARDRRELTGALSSLKQLFDVSFARPGGADLG
jgi:aspartate/methionine/tyrosine aminotransferase